MTSPDLPNGYGSNGLMQGRAKRALGVGTLATSVGGSYAWDALTQPFRSAEAGERARLDLHLKNALRIVERSRELRGAFMKLIQMLSMRGELFPSEVMDVLSVVQSSVPPMEYPLIKRQLRRELGANPKRVFERFEKQAFAAASLGQVHRAELRSGEPVVVKVQYPGVDETVEHDLKNLKAVLQIFTLILRDVLRQDFDAGEIAGELEARLREEVDYRNEAANAALFGRLFAADADVVIPRVYPEFSSRRVLTLDYVEGYPLRDALAPGVDPDVKDWLAVKYFEVTWQQIFSHGVLHADPHPGNYLVTYHPKLAMLDFGSVRFFSDALRDAHRRLALAVLQRDEAAMAGCFVELSYLDADADPKPLIRIMYLIFEPVLEDRVYDPRDFHSLDKTREVTDIGLRHRLFKAPGHRLLLVRALLGLEAYVQQFGTVTNWHRLFRRCLEASAPAQPVDGVAVS